MKWSGVGALLAVGCLVVVAYPAGGIGSARAATTGMPGSFDSYHYTDSFGSRDYRVYVPPGYTGSPLPMLLELHGCDPDSAEVEARWSRFNQLASQLNFFVVYPQQNKTYSGTDYASATANGSGCWNWFRPEDWNRDVNEPAMLAGITRTVKQHWWIDSRRVYVGGISAGGAMANVMAVTYPDVFAAALVYAGCEYMATANCLGSVSATPSLVSGQLAYQQMASRARVVPVIVVQGDIDPVVPMPNSLLVVQQWLATDALATGNTASPASVLPTTTTPGAKPGGQSYSIEDYRDSGGCLLVERWIISGMLHQWSDAVPDGSTTDTIFTDPSGPDVTSPIWQFMLSHPMSLHSSPGCYTEPGHLATVWARVA